jgi:uncharacterized Zn finger protein
MAIIEAVRCPNCGSLAERHHESFLAQVKTECNRCDYLMVTCTRSGRVVEAYAPGLSFERARIKKMPISRPLEKITEPHLAKPHEVLAKANFISVGASNMTAKL